MYCLTQVGFGSYSVHKMMTAVLRTMLKRGENKIKNATNSYLDVILVDESISNVKELICYLKRFG